MSVEQRPVCDVDGRWGPNVEIVRYTITGPEGIWEVDLCSDDAKPLRALLAKLPVHTFTATGKRSRRRHTFEEKIRE